MPLVKYALEVLLVLIIAPIRVKKKIKLKDGKLTVETVEETPEEENKEETAANAEQSVEIQETTEETKNLQEINEASSQPAEQP